MPDISYNRRTKVLTIRKESLIETIARAKLAGYAGEGEGVYRDPSHSKGMKQFERRDGGFTFYDQFAGDRTFFGIENVSAAVMLTRGAATVEQAVWAMSYGGSVLVDRPHHHRIFDFLMEALKHFDRELPYRGPGPFRSKKFPGYEYTVAYRPILPSFERASGTETISLNKRVVYLGSFTGGVAVTQRGSIRLV